MTNVCPPEAYPDAADAFADALVQELDAPRLSFCRAALARKLPRVPPDVVAVLVLVAFLAAGVCR